MGGLVYGAKGIKSRKLSLPAQLPAHSGLPVQTPVSSLRGYGVAILLSGSSIPHERRLPAEIWSCVPVPHIGLRLSARARIVCRPDYSAWIFRGRAGGTQTVGPNKPLHLTRRACRILEFAAPRARRAGERNVRPRRTW
jgi:hypothetical protein